MSGSKQLREREPEHVLVLVYDGPVCLVATGKLSVPDFHRSGTVSRATTRRSQKLQRLAFRAKPAILVLENCKLSSYSRSMESRAIKRSDDGVRNVILCVRSNVVIYRIRKHITNYHNTADVGMNHREVQYLSQ